MSKGPEATTDKKWREGTEREKGGESRGQMGELASTWHTLHGIVCMCVPHNSGNYLSR